MGTYTVNLPPDQIANIIRQRHSQTTFTGSKIKVRGSFWTTTDLKVQSAPMPTVLKSAHGISGGMTALIVVLLILGFFSTGIAWIIALIIAVVHYATNKGLGEELIRHVNSQLAYSGYQQPGYPPPPPGYPPQQPGQYPPPPQY